MNDDAIFLRYEFLMIFMLLIENSIDRYFQLFIYFLSEKKFM
ncbi:hypothetical protein N779_00795 [Vibrio coralliilyticus OCN008]|nr:hypothetical protein N779_00795 [Vibrio coralliilyticus OCN008]